MSVKVSLIGSGRIAQEHLACLQQLPGVQVVGVCDRLSAVAEMTAERFGIPAWFNDHRQMLETAKADVVHVTTGINSHLPLAMDALNADSHVLVEKPITVNHQDFLTLKSRAQETGRLLMEDHNYLFNEGIQRILGFVRSGEFGPVEHIDVLYSASIMESWSPFADKNIVHPTMSLPGGPIRDFLPHLCYLTYAFVGPHRSVRTLWRKRVPSSPFPADEFRALIEAEHGTATVSFSANVQPNSIWVRVYGTKMQAEANLMEPRWNVDRVRSMNPGLLPFVNQMKEARDVGRSAFRSLWYRLAAKSISYQGVWEFLRQTYQAIQNGTEMPVPLKQIEAVSLLVEDLAREEFKF
jgi:predicted dehydrogenase